MWPIFQRSLSNITKIMGHSHLKSPVPLFNYRYIFFFRQIDELREALSGNERSAIRIEERVRRERDDLMTKLQESESR